jgi:hypothetical protein
VGLLRQLVGDRQVERPLAVEQPGRLEVVDGLGLVELALLRPQIHDLQQLLADLAVSLVGQ